MGVERSKRAEILKRLLPYINTGNYAEEGHYIVFGASSVWDMIMDLSGPPSEQEDHSLEDAVNNLNSDLQLYAGRSQAAARLSLNQAPNFKTNALEGLSAEQRQSIHEAFVKLSRESHDDTVPSHMSPSSHDEDMLDTALAEEMLGKLPKAVDRALRLEKLGIALEPNENVKSYFEEAHRCYLYGFHVACAVLCRAILASALEHICDPQGEIRRQVPRGGSYFEELVKRASGDHLLVDDRPDWAIKIRNAGNDAIHGLPGFKKYWRNKLDEILLNTRKVLLDLYAGESGTPGKHRAPLEH